MTSFNGIQIIWGLLYLCNMSVLFLAMILFVIKYMQDKYSCVEKVITALGITPFFLSGWMIVVSFMPQFFLKQYFVIIVPVIVALIFVILNYQLLFSFAKKICAYISEHTFSCVCVFSLVLIFAYSCIHHISGYVRYTDIGFYTAEALHFVRSLSFHDIIGLSEPSSHLNGSVQNFIWPAYISYGMLFSELGQFGLHHDLAMIIGIRILPVLVIVLTILFIFEITDKNSKMLLVGILLLMFCPLSDVIGPYCRDYFRILPLIVLMTLLHRELLSDEKCSVKEGILWITIGACVFSGHVINAFSVLAIGLAWAIIHIMTHKEIMRIITIGASLGIGILIGTYNIIYALIVTGSMDGGSSLDLQYIFKGTDIEKLYMDDMVGSTSRGLGVWGTLRKIFSVDRDPGHLMWICALMILVYFFLLIMHKISSENLFPVLVYIISFFVIFLGHYVRWGGGIAYDEWLARNYRYSFQFYFMAVFVIIVVIFELQKIIKYNFIERVIVSGVVVIGVILSCFAIFQRHARLGAYKQIERAIATQAIDQINNVLDMAEIDGKEVWITQTDYTYDTGLRANLLSSFYGIELFHAKTAEDVRAFLDSRNIKYMCFENSYRNWLYKDSNFYNIMMNMDEVTPYLENGYLIIYEYHK